MESDKKALGRSKDTFSESKVIGWFSTLSKEQQIRYAPSYISLLQEQLAQGNLKYQKLWSQIAIFEKVNRDGQIRYYRQKVCRNCLEISSETEVFECGMCGTQGCHRCNTERKRILQCIHCNLFFCEKCDGGFFIFPDGRYYATFPRSNAIFDAIKEKTEKLTKSEITRKEAIILWSIKDVPGLEKLPFFQKHSSKCVSHILDSSIQFLEWCCCSFDEVELLKDFSELGGATKKKSYMLIPRHHVSPNYITLVDDIYNLFSGCDDNTSLEDTSSEEYSKTVEIYSSLHQRLYTKSNSFRTTLTVGELLEPYFSEDPPSTFFTKERREEIAKEYPGFFERVFD